MQLRTSGHRDRADAPPIGARIVGVPVHETVVIHARQYGIAKCRQGGSRRGILVLEKVAHVDTARGSEQLLQPTIVIEVLMGEDHDIDRRVVETERVEVPAERFRVRTAIDDHSARSVPYVSRVSLADVEQAHD